MSSPVTPSALVSTQWLADHLGSDNLVTLDATIFPVTMAGGAREWRSGYDDYLTDHIPGAVFADLISEFSDPDGSWGFARPSAAQFERAAASVGIDNDTTVVVYDASIGQWAARLWWLFRSFGYDAVAVLDGGLVKWHGEERPSDDGAVELVSVAGFTANPRPELWVDRAFVESVVAGTTDAVLVCSLPADEFSGRSDLRPRRGHIPGSASLPSARLVDADSNAFLRGDELKERLAPVLAPVLSGTATRVVTYCGSGIAASLGALMLTVAGTEAVSIYDGSLNEWAADDDAPLLITA